MRQNLDDIEDVSIDADGRYKYILIHLKFQNQEKYIVRGYAWAEYHADILDDFEAKLQDKKDVFVDCVGGGRILNESDKKKLLVYGYSQGFGRANHEISVSLIKKKYPDYVDITYSNDGY